MRMLQESVWHDQFMPAPWTLLALPPLSTEHLAALFTGVDVELVVPRERSPAALLEVAPRAEIILGDWTGVFRLSEDVVRAASRLALVQQPSVGTDTIDLSACTSAGVTVANAGSANATSVAEWCVGATFAVLRSLAHGDREMRAGRWPQTELAGRGGGELATRRVGIVGMGGIARECARRFVALGSDVAHWSRSRREPADAAGTPWLPLDDLLARSDVLLVVVALAPETRGLIGADQLARLPRGAFVINAARGGIVDEAALLGAIGSGALAGGALDVYDTEPLPADSPLLTEDRLLLSPHAAGTTVESMTSLLNGFVGNIRRAVEGQEVIDVVNGLPPLIRRREG